MVDKEMLSAISSLLDDKLQPVHDRLDCLEENANVLKEDVGELKEDVNVLKEDVGELKEDVNVLREDVGGLKEGFGSLKEEVHYVRVVLLENNVLSRLSTIEKCYTDTFRQYAGRAERIDGMASDITTLQDVVKEHSKMLQAMQG